VNLEEQVRQCFRGLVDSLDQLGDWLFEGSAQVDVVFALPASVEAETVALAGEFNGWSRVATLLERGDDGAWRAVLTLGTTLPRGVAPCLPEPARCGTMRNPATRP
jgi:hypothetical protein